MAEAAEAEAIRLSAEEERLRMHARVEPSIARVGRVRVGVRVRVRVS